MEIRFKRLALSALLLCVVSTNGFFSYAQASEVKNEQHYISPRLQLGLHTQASLDSPIKILIRSGMAIEVIKTEHEFSQIKTAKGDEGWIKSKFITNEEPAAQRIEKMQADLLAAEELLNARDDSPQADTDMTSESTLSDSEKTAYEQTIQTLQEELNAWEQLDHQDKLAQKKQAEKMNQVLKEKLAMIASVAIGQDVDTSHFELSKRGELPEPGMKPKETLVATIKKNAILLLMVSGVSFIFGIFIVDLINRKRHGGYRI